MNRLYRYERSAVFGDQACPLSVRRVASQSFCPPHEHDFIEIVLTVSGSAYQETALRRLPIKSGSVTILRPGHWHSYSQCRKLVIYNCCFGAELLRREMAWLIDDPKLAWLLWGTGENGAGSAPPVFTLSPAHLKKLQQVLDGFRKCNDSTYGIKISWLSLFLTTLAANLPVRFPSSEDHNKMHPAVIKAIRLVEGDLAAAWTIRDLAAKCGSSSEYLIRLFKTSIGMTPYAYINRSRAERAAALLLRSSASVGEIGQQVGWGEPCHFSRRFKQQFGMAATVYRAHMKM